MPAGVVPQKITRTDKHKFGGINLRPGPGTSYQVGRVDDSKQCCCDPADILNDVNGRSIKRDLPPRQLLHPVPRKQRRRNKQVDIEYPTQRQVKSRCERSARLSFEIVNPRKSILLHDAVLMVPQNRKDRQCDRSPGDTRCDDGDQNERTKQQSGFPPLALFADSVSSQPGDKVVRRSNQQRD